jgi:hypothetical protein
MSRFITTGAIVLNTVNLIPVMDLSFGENHIEYPAVSVSYKLLSRYRRRHRPQINAIAASAKRRTRTL